MALVNECPEDSSKSDSESTLCRLCMKNHDYYVNIFTSNVKCKVAVKDVLLDLVGLKVAVGDGLPATVCPLCLKKLMEFSDFKKICYKSEAELRKLSSSIDLTVFKVLDTYFLPEHDSEVLDKASDMDVLVGLLKEKLVTAGSQREIIQLLTLAPTSWIMKKVATEINSIKEEGSADDELGFSAETNDSIQNVILGTSQNACAVKTTEIYIPVPDCQLPEANMLSNVKEEEEDHVAEGNYHVLDAEDAAAGISSNASDPLATHDISASVGNGEPMENYTMAHEDLIQAVVLPGPNRVHLQKESTSYLLPQSYLWIDQSNNYIASPAFVQLIECKGGTSHAGEGRNVMVRDLKKCGTLPADERTISSIPDDGQGLKINFGTSKSDVEAESSMGKDESLKTLVSSEEYSIFCEPSTSKTLKGLGQKGNEPVLDISGGICEKESVRQESESVVGDGKTRTHRRTSELSSCMGNLSNQMCASTSETTYSCNVCSKVFADGSELQQHTLTHAGEEAHVCGVCAKTFSTHRRLALHMNSHGGEKPYSCSECAKSFSRKSYLAVHFRTHTGEKPYVCGICLESFSQGYQLECHAQTHTGEKSYPCAVCQRSFALRSYLKKHMRTHTGEKPYSCSVCSKTFAYSNNLNDHLRTHTGERPYPCGLCAKSFPKISSLNEHMRTHGQGKPFTCTICHKSFSLRSYLTKHKRTHKGVGPRSGSD